MVVPVICRVKYQYLQSGSMGAAQTMKSSILPSWCYRNPEDIADGLIARTRRLELVETVKPKPARKDRYYTQSRAIAISSIVRHVKRNGGAR
jgi:hypothetical protein